MGLLRSVAKFVFGTLFTLSLVCFATSWILRDATSYESLKPIAVSVFGTALKERVGEENAEQLLLSMNAYCRLFPNKSFELPFGYANTTVSLRCGEIVGKNSTEIVSLVGEKLFNITYYKDYGCEFVDCVRKGLEGNDTSYLLVFASREGNEFFSRVTEYSLIATLVTMALFFVSSESWFSRLREAGIILVLLGLPSLLLVNVEAVKWYLTKTLPEEARDVASPVVGSFLESSLKKLAYFLIAGIALIIVAYCVKRFREKR